MVEEAQEVSPVERNIEKLKAYVKTPEATLKGAVLDYIIPILEGQREEYVGGFELVEERIDEEVGADPGFIGRVMGALVAIGTFNDQVLKRAGWADDQGAVTKDCPDDLKVAFGAAQASVTALMGELQQMQPDPDDEEETE